MKYRVILLSCLALNIALFSKDIYIPSLPALATDIHIAPASISMTVTLFLIGLAISQLIFGPLSDAKGRKPVILLGLGICLIGNAASFLSHSAFTFLGSRFIAGFGAGACPVISRAIANDQYKNDELTKASSYLSMTTVISPLLAPVIGGFLQDHYGWRINFVFLSLLTLASYLLFYKIMAESNASPSHAINIKKIISNSVLILKNKTFLAYSMLSIIAFAPGVIYAIISPFIFQETLGLTATQNGFVYIYLAIGYFIGTMLTNTLAGKIHDDTIILCGTIVSAVSGLFMLAYYYLFSLTIFSMTIPMLINFIGSGLITPVANKQGIALFGTIAGLSAAIIGSFRMLGAFLTALLIPIMSIDNPETLAVTLIVFATLSFVILYCKKRNYEEEYRSGTIGKVKS